MSEDLDGHDRAAEHPGADAPRVLARLLDELVQRAVDVLARQAEPDQPLEHLLRAAAQLDAEVVELGRHGGAEEEHEAADGAQEAEQHGQRGECCGQAEEAQRAGRGCEERREQQCDGEGHDHQAELAERAGEQDGAHGEQDGPPRPRGRHAHRPGHRRCGRAVPGRRAQSCQFSAPRAHS